MKVVIDGDKTKNQRGNRATELLEHISALFTKEEVIATLEEIQLEIEEWSFSENIQNKNRMVYMKRVDEVIQQKIDKLKENKDGLDL